MLLQAQASVPVKFSTCLTSSLTQDLSDTFGVIKTVEQAAPETPSSHCSLGPVFTQSVSRTILLENCDNPFGSPAGDWQPNLHVSYLFKKVTSCLSTS